MRVIILMWFMLRGAFAHCQETGEILEQQIAVESNEGNVEEEDDGYLQNLAYYLRHPVNLNTITPELLENIFRLDGIQVLQFVRYRKLLGPFIDVMELQAIPGWDIEMIRRLIPYITITGTGEGNVDLFALIKKGSHQILLRTSMVMEKSTGYLKKDGEAPDYIGSRLKAMLKYGFNYNNQLQWGITAEKDAGEPLLKSGYKKGFDFYSLHLLLRRKGFLKTIIAGDYQINIGQGLIHWQGMAFKKSAENISGLRQGPAVKVFKGLNENLFHRGGAIQLGKKKWELTMFAAADKVDANLIADSVSGKKVISSWQTSGLHRTQEEIKEKNAAFIALAGLTGIYKTPGVRIGLNGIHYRINHFIQKKYSPENLYEISGRKWSNFSFDYRLNYRNHLLYGELAVDHRKSFAFVSGILSSLHPQLDLSVLYRHIPGKYRAFQADAFTVNAEPENEYGLFTGLYIRPTSQIRISGYFDYYHFPWLKNNVDAPSYGYAYALQLNWKPDKKRDLVLRWQMKTGYSNKITGNNALNIIDGFQTGHLKVQTSYQLRSPLTVRNRMDFVYRRETGTSQYQGFLVFTELIYKKPVSPLTISFRLAFFNCDDYRTGVAVFERDVLYSYSISVLYDKGLRYYTLVHYKFNKYFQLWLKWMQTYFTEKQSIGTQKDEILLPRRSEFRLQLFYIF